MQHCVRGKSIFIHSSCIVTIAIIRYRYSSVIEHSISSFIYFSLSFYLFYYNFVSFSFGFRSTRRTLDLPSYRLLFYLLYHIFLFVCFLSSLTSHTLIHSFIPATHLNRNTNNKDLSHFGLGASNTHWGYGSAASAYSPYLASSGLSSCTTPTSAQFNNPALGFTCSSNDQSNNQDFGGATNRDCVPSKC